MINSKFEIPNSNLYFFRLDIAHSKNIVRAQSRTSVPGYTLLELLFAITLFSAILAVIFTMFSSLRATETFREQNVRLTQAAGFAYEPIIRNIKQASAIEEIKKDGQCISVRGFYGQAGGTKLTSALNQTNMTIVTISADKTFSEANGTVYEWVRREYERAGVEGKESLVEKTSKVVVPEFLWPKPLSCHNDTIWGVPTVKTLTPSNVRVSEFKARLLAPVLASTSTSFQQSPFVTVKLVVETTDKNLKVPVPPVTFESTVVPTFSYGEARND